MQDWPTFGEPLKTQLVNFANKKGQIDKNNPLETQTNTKDLRRRLQMRMTRADVHA